MVGGVASGFIAREPRVGELEFIPQLLLPVGDAVGEDDADGFVEVEAAPGGAADVEVD